MARSHCPLVSDRSIGCRLCIPHLKVEVRFILQKGHSCPYQSERLIHALLFIIVLCHMLLSPSFSSPAPCCWCNWNHSANAAHLGGIRSRTCATENLFPICCIQINNNIISATHLRNAYSSLCWYRAINIGYQCS